MNFSRIRPPASFFAFAVIEVLVHFAVPIMQLLTSPMRWGGVLLIGAGAWFTLEADRLFKRHGMTWKPDETPTTLIREGPFRFSRNPMYFGMLLALIGEAFLLGSVTPFLAPVAFFLMVNTLYVATEEKTLGDVFGEEFAGYKKQVRKWI